MLANAKIRAKLIAIIIVPLVALTILGTVQITQAITSAVQASRAQQLTGFAVGLTGLIRELQRESALSAPYLGSGRRAAFRPNMLAQRAFTDRAVGQYRASLGRLDLGAYDDQVRQTLAQAQTQLAQLPRQRTAIDSDRLRLGQAIADYNRTADALLSVNNRIATGTTDRELIRNATAFVALSRAQHYAAQERDLLAGLLAAGPIRPDEVERLTELVGSEQSWLTQFQQSANPAQQASYRQAIANRHVERANALIRFALLGGQAARRQVDPNTWYFLVSLKIDQLRQVELRLAADVTAASRRTRGAATSGAATTAAAILLVLGLMVSVSLLIARSMAAPLRRLQQAAITVAEQTLPGTVARLERAASPAELELVPEPVPVRSSDEIGEVAAAFNTVHQVAVRIASQQAALRRSVADMFLNLARRSQRLIDRQLELMDELEQEAEPTELEQLFRVDHLATRMRRNAENLIVLSGAEPSRRWSEPVPLEELIRSAIQEVEDYRRVELLPIGDIAVVGRAVVDISHLLAELIENATSFSAPNTPVTVAGQPSARGYVIEIEDRGLGMGDSELRKANQRLADPPEIDFTLSRVMGLFVVGRLSQRHGVQVQLRHSWYGGIAALVQLPSSLILGDRGRRPAAEPPAAEASPAQSAPPAGAVPPLLGQTRADWFHADSPPPRPPGTPLSRDDRSR